MESANGAVAALSDQYGSLQEHLHHAQATRAKLVKDMQALLSEEEEVLVTLQAEVKASKDRRDHLARALDHLTGNTTKYRNGNHPAKQEERKKGSWELSEGVIQKVLAGLKAEPEPITPTQLAKRISSAHETTSRALTILRERELVRLCGSTRGGGKLYQAMPEVLADAA